MRLQVLVLAKAPQPGRVKTRLAASVGEQAAARLAAASLTDVLDVVTATVGPGRAHLCLEGDLDEATTVGADGVRSGARGWTWHRQRGRLLGERIAHAHGDVAARVPGAPTLQLGMDTPQITQELLDAVGAGLRRHDAVVAPARDGGWWGLALRDPTVARALTAVAMSTPMTGTDTVAALRGAGLSVGGGPLLEDVDTAVDAMRVARIAPTSRFAARWREVGTTGRALSEGDQ